MFFRLAVAIYLPAQFLCLYNRFWLHLTDFTGKDPSIFNIQEEYTQRMYVGMFTKVGFNVRFLLFSFLERCSPYSFDHELRKYVDLQCTIVLTLTFSLRILHAVLF
jgi:hypothetical protein